MKTTYRLLVFFSLSVLALLSGCGGSSSNSGNTTPIQQSPPTVTSISPTTVTAGSGDVILTVNGSGFLTTTTVQVGSVAEATSYVSATQLTATVPAAQVAVGGQFAVIALNGSASSGAGAAINLQVNNPAPVISQITPTTLSVGTVPVTIAVSGSGFVPTTTIDANGSARTTVFVSATQVNATLTAADVASTGSMSLTAVNLAPGGGTSAAVTAAISNPAPGAAIKLSPSLVVTGTATPTTVTVTGTNFIPASTVQVSGTARTTTYVSATQLTFQLTAADQATSQVLPVTVVNPAPGGGASLGATLEVLPQMPTPVITSLSPSQLIVGSSTTWVTVYGSNLFVEITTSPNSEELFPTSNVLWNGTSLTNNTNYEFGLGYNGQESITFQVPASLLTTAGTASITVSDSTSVPPTSNALTMTIANPPPPTLTSISPNAGPINTATPITLSGSGFTASSTVAMNGSNIAATYVSSTELTATIPASSVTLPGSFNFTVTTPAPGGGTTAPLAYMAYVGIANNSMVYNPTNGLFYVSVPSSAGAPYGNSVVSVDPETGALGTPIPVGSEPDKLAISSDGTVLWVGLDGASAVRQVNLTTGTAGLQFTLSGNGGIYETPPTVLALAALPGAANSVVVALNGSAAASSPAIGIYDSGVLRGTGGSNTADALQANGTTGEIYAAGSGVYAVYTYSASGLTLKGTASNGSYGSYNSDDLQVAGGRAYTDYGKVYDAEAGALLGTFYASGTVTAQGPTVADTTLGLAFILDSTQQYSGNYTQIQSFNLSTFTPASSAVIPVSIDTSSSGSSPSHSPSHLTRWGSNGLAFCSGGGVYSLRSNLVKDLSTTSADLGVTVTASGGTTTGTNTTFTATVKNAGPSAATNVALTATLPVTGVLVSATPSAGSCATSNGVVCDLGGIANGGSATVTFVVLEAAAGSATTNVQVSGSENDPAQSNNQASATTAVTGSAYNLTPGLISISPAGIEAGSSDTTITLTGTGFTTGSTVKLGTTALTTTFTNSTTLTATVPAAQLASMGWGAVTVSNPAPGGGSSSALPLTIFQVLTAGVNHLLYEPFSRKIYASSGSGSATLAGNSIVAITPESGSFGTPVYVGSQPTKMAISDDGNILYALLGGASSVARFNLQTQKTEFSFTPPPSNYGVSTNGFRDVAVQPGSENTIVVDFGYTGGMAIIDVNPTAQTAAIRGTGTGIYTGTSLQFFDPLTLYLFNTDTWQTLDKYAITSSGFNYSPTHTSSTLLHFGTFKLRGKLGFADAGGVADVTTTPATQLGTFASLTQNGATQSVAPDTSLGESFFLSNTTANAQVYGSPDGIVAYNQSTYMPAAVLPLNMATIEGSSSFDGVDLVRWGQDGLAALTSSGHIYLLRGPFVTPQLLQSNSAASLSASSSSSLTHGAGNTMLTLTGANFVPGVAVTWNGSYRTTTIVDATHLLVAIPASDLVSAGSGSLLATNPGATASNALTIAIQ
jgi:hypothetical protein